MIYWLALMDRFDIVPNSKIEQAYNKFNSIIPLWQEEFDFLRNLGLSNIEAAKFVHFRNSVGLEKYRMLSDALVKQGIRVCRYVDAEYPQHLKDFGAYHIQPPLGLFIKGSMDRISEGVAVVGTRACSFYGHSMARKIARTVANNGYTVISGLARGVDTEAHCGALEASSGKTIAVLPWMDRIYPEENINLAKDIAERGCLVSEHYWPPRERSSQLARAAFVIGNKKISGLSRCVVLIETGRESGTVRQDNIPLKQGCRVLAPPPKQGNKEAF